ncbi:MAG: extracellular solute-binding protein [Patescibacteria group bacterium]|nr:extracellular solute-binding protein [Patescibacteria group bacterium]MDD5715948.1 extracellular solute-binding protein [Patescibacteria group bacterium]
MKMRLSHAPYGLSKLLIIALFGVIALILGGVVYTLFTPKKASPPAGVTLTVWGVWDESTDVSSLFSSYSKAHPYVKLVYTKIRSEEYEDKLLKAWATDSGPDMYALPNSWIHKYSEDFISPMAKKATVAYYETKKTLFKTETQYIYRTEPGLAADVLKRTYISNVYDDVVINNQIYALPFGINTLVMYYNRELLNQALLAEPPASWEEFKQAVMKLAVVDDEQNVLRAGTALGTYDNIPHATDLVTLLMMQFGTQMTTGGKVSFQLSVGGDDVAIKALDYYTAYSSPEREAYTWNTQMPNAVDYFCDNQLGFMFGYRYEQTAITNACKGVDFGIAAVPQVDPNYSVNYANYWAYTVSKKSKNAALAWNFLQYVSNSKRVAKYLDATKQASVLKSVLDEQLKNPETAYLAQQALTAKSWYRGRDPRGADDAFQAMIEAIVENNQTIGAELRSAASKIQSTY